MPFRSARGVAVTSVRNYQSAPRTSRLHDGGSLKSTVTVCVCIIQESICSPNWVFKPTQHYVRIMHSVLSVSAVCETLHCFHEIKVIGLPGRDTVSSLGRLPQNLKSHTLHRFTNPMLQGGSGKGSPLPDCTDYADYGNTNRSYNPSSEKSASLSPSRP